MENKIYKIVNFIEDTGQIEIQVEGYHSLIAIDVPIDENNNYIIGNELHLYINGFIPYEYIKRIKKMKESKIKNAEFIKSLVEPITVENVES